MTINGPTMGETVEGAGMLIQDVNRGRLCPVKLPLGRPGGGVIGVWYWKMVTELDRGKAADLAAGETVRG